ncbi:MAG: hypothetical protein ACLUD2_03930 [Clostridium sp.]
MASGLIRQPANELTSVDHGKSATVARCRWFAATPLAPVGYIIIRNSNFQIEENPNAKWHVVRVIDA